MSNTGKVFERDFMKCAPVYVAVLRLPDAAQSFGHSSYLRFSSKNPFDYLLWNPKTLTLYALELKTVKGKSISFERTKEDKGEIHFHQVEGLKKFNDVGESVCGFIIEFRELEKTIFLSISEYEKLVNIISKKSFNLNDLDNNGIQYNLIPQKVMKTHYKYDLEYFLEETTLHKKEVKE